MKKNVVLVTGSSGFTGKYVVQELELQGFAVVRGIVDLRNYNEVLQVVKDSKPNFVIHLAALAFVANNSINDLYEVNLLGTVNLLKALTEVKLELFKVILASSANIYGNCKVDKIDEFQAPAPENHYGVSKYSMELAAAQWQSQLPLLFTRPFNYTGVGQHKRFLIPKIISHFQLKEPVIELGNLDVYRDFSDVRDIARYYSALLNVDTAQLHVNLCSSSLWSLQDIIAHLVKITGHRIDVKVNESYVRSNEIKKLCGDNSTLRKLVDIKSSISFRDTLEWMLKQD
ncbi:GDP-mannose 4,6-dehydratase [Paraglaciecola sp. 20A4]|uniref:GDP-mannose 4,6-dehydratase n=1 Tax=Paraglaciecola sp. 20A4 TaxID=2687288 RepID=UPI00140A2828|nr:GDP-mannose 4,6-dehydratase [Paraglaciecola sp. 20A4]